MYPARVTLVEVGPRDGLQNEATRLPVDAKVRLIAALAAAGLTRIEVGSFVRPDWIPQLADTDLVAQRAPKLPGVRYSALVPNRTGLDRAIASGLQEVAVFMSATESHNLKNTNKSVAESLQHFREIVPAALKAGLMVRAYLSTVWSCPYEGKVDAAGRASPGARRPSAAWSRRPVSLCPISSCAKAPASRSLPRSMPVSMPMSAHMLTRSSVARFPAAPGAYGQPPVPPIEVS